MQIRRPPSTSGQAGFMLLEVLVSILIFAIGVLSIVGLQVSAVKQSSAAKYRTDASLLANDLIGKMWVTDRTFATIDTNFKTGGTAFNAWLPGVQSALPGSTTHTPTVVTESVAAGVVGDPPSTKVTLTLQWKAPNEPTTDPVHQLVVVTQIK